MRIAHNCNLILVPTLFNPIALRNAKIVYNFGLSECNKVKVLDTLSGEAALSFHLCFQVG